MVIIDAIAKYLDIPRERYLSNVDRVGNTSSASLPILLDEAVRGVEDGVGGAVVFLEADDGGVLIVFIEIEDVRDDRAAEFIDRLVVVADRHYVVPASA